MSTTEYCKRIAKENNMEVDLSPTFNLSWADQMDINPTTTFSSIEEVSLPSFKFSTQPREAHMEISYTLHMYSLLLYEAPDHINLTVIPYNTNQPTDLTL